MRRNAARIEEDLLSFLPLISLLLSFFLSLFVSFFRCWSSLSTRSKKEIRGEIEIKNNEREKRKESHLLSFILSFVSILRRGCVRLVRILIILRNSESPPELICLRPSTLSFLLSSFSFFLFLSSSE